MADYVTAALAFVCGKLPALEASSFCDIWKITSYNFTSCYLFLTPANLCFFYMCLITMANLCPNMIYVDAFHFSDCRSEEVIIKTSFDDKYISISHWLVGQV